ncbi:MAG: hypothetical protein WC542_08350 [Paludibacter sp.]
MIKSILLLTPIYVTLFWSIVLNTDARKYDTPRLFLGKFMLFALIVYISHFLFFLPYPDWYAIIDPFYQYASLLVYPLYHIYFRLLTVDDKFTFKVHAPYLIAPTILFLFYSFGAFFTNFADYKLWIFDRAATSNLFVIQYLNVVHLIIRITFLIQVVLTLVGNQHLIKKYGKKAEQYYSNLEDSRTCKVKILNFSMIVTGCSSFILGVLGRDFFSNEITGIAIASVIFSSMLFIIGWLGDKQKSLNPTFETISGEENQMKMEEFSTVAQKKILEKLLILFNDKKVYMDSGLNIQDIAQAVGTNRTYISTIINQQFNQNFCTFVNNYRVEELENTLKNHPEFTNQLLAESCGFGSVDSLKRAVLAKTEQTFPEWKKQVLSIHLKK